MSPCTRAGDIDIPGRGTRHRSMRSGDRKRFDERRRRGRLPWRAAQVQRRKGHVRSSVSYTWLQCRHSPGNARYRHFAQTARSPRTLTARDGNNAGIFTSGLWKRNCQSGGGACSVRKTSRSSPDETGSGSVSLLARQSGYGVRSPASSATESLRQRVDCRDRAEGDEKLNYSQSKG